MGNIRKLGHIVYVFAYVLDICATLPYPIMDSTTVGRQPKAAGPLLWRRPKASSIWVLERISKLRVVNANLFRKLLLSVKLCLQLKRW